MESKVAET